MLPSTYDTSQYPNNKSTWIETNQDTITLYAVNYELLINLAFLAIYTCSSILSVGIPRVKPKTVPKVTYCHQWFDLSHMTF